MDLGSIDTASTKFRSQSVRLRTEFVAYNRAAMTGA